MNVRDSELDRLLAEWLEDDPQVASATPVEAAVDFARTHPRRRDWLAFLRRDAMTTRAATGLPPVAILIAVVAVLVLAVGGAVYIGSRPDATPTPIASPTATAATAKNVAIVHALGWLPAYMLMDEAPVADPDFEGLTRYEFASDRRTPTFGPLSISLDPSAGYSGDVPTGEALVLRLVISEAAISEAAAEFVSSDGECTVTFVNVNADVIDGTFACVQVPAIEGKGKADVDGTFSFAP